MKKHAFLVIILVSLIYSVGLGQYSRENAIDHLLNQVLVDTTNLVVYGSKNIITDRDTLELIGDHVTGVYPNNWMFFIDDHPSANWLHDCRYVCFDASNGDYSIIEKNSYPLTLNVDFEILKDQPTTAGFTQTVLCPQPAPCEPNPHLYAVITCLNDGGALAAPCRHWNNTSAVYSTLINVYGYKEENIFVHFGDGYTSLKGADLDGDGDEDDFDYNVSHSRIEETFKNLSGEWTTDSNVPKLDIDDHLFVFTTGHGGINLINPVGPTPVELITMGPNLRDVDLADYVKNIECAQMIFMFGQCNSGGFKDDLMDFTNYNVKCKNRVIHTAVQWNRSSFNEQIFTGAEYDEFVWYWNAAVRGYYPVIDQPWLCSIEETGTVNFVNYLPWYIPTHPGDIDPDLNNDGVIQMAEAFNYAYLMDSRTELHFNHFNNTSEWERPQKVSEIVFDSQDDLMSLSGLCGHVTVDQTVANTAYLAGGYGLVVDAYTDLILENTTISFTKVTDEIVTKISANLTLDNSTLTNPDIFWKGITVEGNDQTIQTNTSQGVLNILNASLIKNAEKAVYAEGGAIVTALESEFKNNIYDIWFEPYQNPVNPNINDSYIRSCSFLTDGYLIDPLTYPEAHISFNSVRDIEVINCSFINSILFFSSQNPYYANYRGTGIRAINSDVEVLPICPMPSSYKYVCSSPLKNTFRGLYYGIKASATNSASSNIYIAQSDFTSNYRGLCLENINNPTIIKNDFYAKFIGLGTNLYNPYPSPYGNSSYSMYLNGCMGYSVEENTFDKGDAGLYIYNSGHAPHEIYKNSFTNIDHHHQASAVNALGINSYTFSASKNNGLTFYCNDFENNEFNISVIGSATIAEYQGGPLYPTGNTTDNNCPNTTSHLNINALSPLPAYYYYYQPGEILSCVTPLIVYQIQSGASNTCPSKLNGGFSSRPLIQALNTLQNQINVAESNLYSVMDGGETEYMLNLVEELTDENFTLSSSTLINASPYLSEKVLLNFIQTEVSGFETEKMEVLLANSPLPKGLLDDIENMELSDDYKNEILGNQNGVNGVVEELMAIAQLYSERQNTLNQLVVSELYDDDIPANLDTLIDVLESEVSPEVNYFLIPIYIRNGLYGEAEYAIQNMEEYASSLNAEDQDELLDYTHLQEIVLAYHIAEDESVIRNNLAFLETLAETDNVIGSVQAQIILEVFDNADYPEKVEYPQILDPRSTLLELSPTEGGDESAETDFIDNGLIQVYPNPADQELIIRYVFQEEGSNKSIVLYNMLGKKTYESLIENNLGERLIDVSSMPKGNYILEIGSNYQKKIQIIH